MKRASLTLLPALALCAGLCSPAFAQDPSAPLPGSPVAPREIISAQARFAKAQLEMLGFLYSRFPDASAVREAFENGATPTRLRSARPGERWPARAPNIKESLPALFASAQAEKLGCQALSGPCQQRASALGEQSAKQVLAAAHPGVELARLVAEL